MIIKLEESLKKATPYMLRNDGAWLTCGVMHPYIKYIQQDTAENQLIDLFTIRPEHLEWFYHNTLNEVAKQDIIEMVSAIVINNYYSFSESLINYLRQTYPVRNSAASKFDIEAAFEKLSMDLNQEFCRARTSNLRWAGDSNEIYFRISSVEFNWFDLIWNVVYNNKQFISDVTVCKDQQTFGGRMEYYKHGSDLLCHIPVDDFINLSGKPILETDNAFINRLRQGQSLDAAFGEWHPYHLRNCVKPFIESYLKNSFK